MSESDFLQWVKAHVTTTGAESVRLTELLMANRHIICNQWNADFADLCICTDRLVDGGRVPEFPNQHTNALHRELIALRSERTRDAMTRYSVSETGERIKGCDCPKCEPPNGSEKYQRVRAKFEEWLKVNKTLAGFFREVPK